MGFRRSTATCSDEMTFVEVNSHVGWWIVNLFWVRPISVVHQNAERYVSATVPSCRYIHNDADDRRADAILLPTAAASQGWLRVVVSGWVSGDARTMSANGRSQSRKRMWEGMVSAVARNAGQFEKAPDTPSPER